MKLPDLYSALLGLYPFDYRARFAREMREAFAESLEDRCKRGKQSVALFALAELAALTFGALREWRAKVTTDSSQRGRTLPDVRKMRPVDVTSQQWFATAGGRLDCDAPTSQRRRAEIRTNFLLDQMVNAIARGDFALARACSYQEMTERRKLRAWRHDSAEG